MLPVVESVCAFCYSVSCCKACLLIHLLQKDMEMSGGGFDDDADDLEVTIVHTRCDLISVFCINPLPL